MAHGCIAGRPVRPLGGGGAPADAAERPQPAGAFSAADTLLPGVLMAWDFCHSYRCACLWLGAVCTGCRALSTFDKQKQLLR